MTETTIRLETITPQKAEAWLLKQELNGKNRKLMRNRVQQFVAMYERGEFDGETSIISLDENDIPSDGQHRLEFVRQIGKPIKMRVMRGVPANFQMHCDDTSVRKLNQVLYTEGETDCNTLAATLRLVHEYENAETFYSARGQALGWPTNQVYVDFYNERRSIREAVRFAASIKNDLVGVVPPALIGALYYIVEQDTGSEEVVEEFFQVLRQGIGEAHHHAILILRKTLNRGTRSVRAKMPKRYQAAITIKGWNAWVTGKDIKSLQWRPAQGEKFPEILTEILT